MKISQFYTMRLLLVWVAPLLVLFFVACTEIGTGSGSDNGGLTTCDPAVFVCADGGVIGPDGPTVCNPDVFMCATEGGSGGELPESEVTRQETKKAEYSIEVVQNLEVISEAGEDVNGIITSFWNPEIITVDGKRYMFSDINRRGQDGSVQYNEYWNPKSYFTAIGTDGKINYQFTSEDDLNVFSFLNFRAELDEEYKINNQEGRLFGSEVAKDSWDYQPRVGLNGDLSSQVVNMGTKSYLITLVNEYKGDDGAPSRDGFYAFELSENASKVKIEYLASYINAARDGNADANGYYAGKSRNNMGYYDSFSTGVLGGKIWIFAKGDSQLDTLVFDPDTGSSGSIAHKDMLKSSRANPYMPNYTESTSFYASAGNGYLYVSGSTFKKGKIGVFSLNTATGALTGVQSIEPSDITVVDDVYEDDRVAFRPSISIAPVLNLGNKPFLLSARSAQNISIEVPVSESPYLFSVASDGKLTLAGGDHTISYWGRGVSWLLPDIFTGGTVAFVEAGEDVLAFVADVPFANLEVFSVSGDGGLDYLFRLTSNSGIPLDEMDYDNISVKSLEIDGSAYLYLFNTSPYYAATVLKVSKK